MKILFIVVLSFVSGTSYSQSEIVSMVADVSALRVEAASTLKAIPYRAKEHQAIKAYFVGLKDFVAQLQANSRTNKRFNTYLADQDMGKVCADLLISSDEWDQIKINCTRNRYFLCAEDVNEYPDSKKALSLLVSSDLLDRFKKTPECQ